MSDSPYDTYTSPLASRNASAAMLRLWSPRHKFNTWRRIWLAVAEAMHEVGLGGTPPPRGGSGSPPLRGGSSGSSPLRGASSSPGWSGTSGTASSLPSSSDSSSSEAASAAGPLVTKEQVEELRAVVERKNADGSVGITDDEIRLAEKYERDLRHDVMAHVHALGDACPKARGIIHLGMTSEDVVSNADWMVLHQARSLILAKIARTSGAMSAFALRWKATPTLGFTHFQPAQPLTVGRRAAQWCHDLASLAFYVRWPKLRGLKGATGTQASFLELFNLDSARVDRLEAGVVNRLKRAAVPALTNESDDQAARHRAKTLSGFESARATAAARKDTRELERLDRELQMYLAKSAEQLSDERARGYVRWQTTVLAGQTYPRVDDCLTLSDLAAVAAVLHKIATDIRLLCNRKELDEPFEDKQIGSSAMPYKRNPMRCERVCGLTRFVMNLVGNAYDTAATQWLERTLDDSSNRRLSLPEAFLALDGALDLMHNVASGLIVHEAMVRRNLMAELPFLATESIMMECVKRGGDRQEYHERIRVHAQAAGLRVKDEGLDNDLIERLKADRAFWGRKRGGPLASELDWAEGPGGLMDPMRYVGRSVEQTERFIKEVVEPLREQYKDAIAGLEESGPRV